jgi:ring-1,2-phenylacetyl-CoA epoxidase subunit PaaE
VSYTVVLDDEVHRFTADAQKSVLDAALNAGLEAPYSCQGGVCGSCIGRVKSGSVEMGNNQILTDAEVDEGLVLSCQASCTSDSLEIDFDDV